MNSILFNHNHVLQVSIDLGVEPSSSVNDKQFVNEGQRKHFIGIKQSQTSCVMLNTFALIQITYFRPRQNQHGQHL